mgnify:CR=1 FL=1
MCKSIEPKRVDVEHTEHMEESIVTFIIYLIAFLSSNAHIEIWAAERDENVKKEANNKVVAR